MREAINHLIEEIIGLIAILAGRIIEAWQEATA